MGYWTKLQSNIKEDKTRFQDDAILRRMRVKGLDFETAKCIMILDSKKNPRRFDPDMKPYRPGSDFAWRRNRLSPEMIQYLDSKEKKFIPKSMNAAYKKGGGISSSVKAAREKLKSTLVEQGFDEKIAEKMSKVIK
jgi:hypothetical protein